ncbi:hypothetical protein C8A00DRAFT_33110 [Chaetomidium leptoderma]|uniref:Uncharacterized protein n=1 Tax=Chaetomidium leptoderma TaxID=669021 RepID=A0AAN6ZW22_9PEZI|nr:hypothetical protein C8A00DRAFT_33110 [Chaetomidium leptoderma]
MSWSGLKHHSAQTQQRNQEDDLTPDKLVLDENGEAYADLIVHDASVVVTFNQPTAERIARGRPNVIGTGLQTTVMPDAPHITARLTSSRFWSANTTVHINTSVNHPNVRNPTKATETLNQRLYPNGFPYRLLTGELSNFSSEVSSPKELYKKLYEKEKKKAEKKAKRQLQKSGNNFDSDDGAGGAGAAGNPPGGSGSSGASGGAGQGGRGAAAGKSRATNPFDILGEEGPTDSQGHAAYYGGVMVKGKASTTLVSVVPTGMSDGKGGLFFCWHFGDKQHSCFATPPAVSKKDPRQARAARLYDLAVKLYKGEVAPLVPQSQYELPIRGAASDSNYTYTRPDSRDGAEGHGAYPARPDSRGGAGGYGAYPARPDSRGGTDGYGAHAPRPDSRGNPVAGNPTPPPASNPTPPPASKPAPKPAPPPPPRNVRPEKSRDKYTVHGIDKGRPYIKGIDKKDPGRHVDVQYSQKEKQYYAKPGSETIWLKEVK